MSSYIYSLLRALERGVGCALHPPHCGPTAPRRGPARFEPLGIMAACPEHVFWIYVIRTLTLSTWFCSSKLSSSDISLWSRDLQQLLNSTPRLCFGMGAALNLLAFYCPCRIEPRFSNTGPCHAGSDWSNLMNGVLVNSKPVELSRNGFGCVFAR